MKNDLVKTAVYGVVVGVVANIVMDVFVALALMLMGSPASLMFSFIGEVAATFFAKANLAVPGGLLTGLLFHYFFGIAYAVVFCIAAARLAWIKTGSLGKSTLLGIAYIELFSQPFVASAPLILRLAAQDTIQWYAMATVMHGVYGAVLGILQHHRGAILARLPSRAAA
jgi:uncharacterized membrane protein